MDPMIRPVGGTCHRGATRSPPYDKSLRDARTRTWLHVAPHEVCSVPSLPKRDLSEGGDLIVSVLCVILSSEGLFIGGRPQNPAIGSIGT